MESDVRCTYAALMGLTCKCSYAYHSDCPTYRKFRRHYLLKEIKPINLPTDFFEKTDATPYGTAVYSRNEAILKQHAAVTAIKHNLKVKKLNFSQVITASMDSLEFEEKILYVEAKACSIDLIKGKQVLASFVDKMILSDRVVFLFSKVPAFVCEDNWIPLKV